MNTDCCIEKKPDSHVTRVERDEVTRSYRPPVDIIEDAEAFTILANMPGVTGDDIDIQIEQGELTVRGRVRDREREGCSFLLREYGVGDFFCNFRIDGEAIDTNEIAAELADGVLTLRLPKCETIKPRRIAIQAD